MVQIYVTTPESPASLQRPIKRLKGFKRVTIPRGQSRLVEIEIDCADLWFWDMDNDRITYDSGKYNFEIGSSSKDIRGTVSANMNGKFTPQLKTVVSDCRVTVLNVGQTAQFVTSAALTDDSFIGLDKTTVKFMSSNPDVAVVDESGLLTAKGSGIATITTIVTYNGKSVSDSYSIKVNPDLTLASLKAGSKSLLKAGSKQYSVLTSKPSKIIAMAKAKIISTSVKQADKVPGTAVVTVADPITGDADTYLVNFGTKGVSDEFNGSSLGKQWSVVREDKAGYALHDGVLEITAAAGDINAAADNAQNLILQSANTDWTIETKLQTSAVPAAPAQNAGLVAYQDDSHFVKLVYAAQGFRRGQQQAAAAPAVGSLQLYAEQNGSAKTTVNVPLADAGIKDNTVWLRLVKAGSVYTAYYSADGKKWVEAGQVDIALKDIQAGVMAAMGAAGGRMGGMRMPAGAQGAPAAQATPAAPFKACFDRFSISSK